MPAWSPIPLMKSRKAISKKGLPQICRYIHLSLLWQWHHLRGQPFTREETLTAAVWNVATTPDTNRQ